MEILSKLFGSATKVKMMRLFLFNPEKTYDTGQIAAIAGAPIDAVRKTARILHDINFLRSRVIVSKTSREGNGKTRPARRTVKGWKLNTEFLYLSALSKLLISTKPFSGQDVTKRLKTIGKIKLLIISGVFIQELDSRLDLLIVGDKIKRADLARAIRGMEAEIGKELVYAVFSTDEFMYRVNMFDKLIRDVVDFPHEVILDKIDLRATVTK